jgi:hypothetical protein
MGLHPRYFGMTEAQVCAMAMLTRSGEAPYDVQLASRVWSGSDNPTRRDLENAKRWLVELAKNVGVLRVVPRGEASSSRNPKTNRWHGLCKLYKPTKLWADAVADATAQGEVLGKCPGCGLEALDLVRWYRPPVDHGDKGQWGYWCGSCMTLEDTDTDCPRCYFGMTVTEITDAKGAEVGLVYLKAVCRRCALRIDSAGIGMYEARFDLEAAKRRRAWEWITMGPRWKGKAAACR